VVEGARLESEYTAKPYRGFESLPLRHLTVSPNLRLSHFWRFLRNLSHMLSALRYQKTLKDEHIVHAPPAQTPHSLPRHFHFSYGEAFRQRWLNTCRCYSHNDWQQLGACGLAGLASEPRKTDIALCGNPLPTTRLIADRPASGNMIRRKVIRLRCKKSPSPTPTSAFSTDFPIRAVIHAGSQGNRWLNRPEESAENEPTYVQASG
jgi:hypothetical protein